MRVYRAFRISKDDELMGNPKTAEVDVCKRTDILNRPVASKVSKVLSHPAMKRCDAKNGIKNWKVR